VREVASSCGDKVETTTDPENFKKIHRSFAPGAVVLDPVLPRVDGIEPLQFLADEQSRAQIVIMSGFDRKVIEAAQRLGEARGMTVREILDKPVRAANLRRCLASLRSAEPG
jgi:FixJ family two-component response regulator